MTYFTYSNINKAYASCKKRKTTTASHIKFYLRLEDNLLDLTQELASRNYRPSASIAFVVKYPKIREVFAANFRDRVVHHLLCDYIEPKFERIFIYDSFACRPGKGTHVAVNRLQSFCHRITRNQPTTEQYYIKMDIRSFFSSIDQKILYELIAKKIKNREILWLAETIIFHDCASGETPPKLQSPRHLFDKLPPDKSLFKTPKGKGLPIGNLTSQFFANVYLNELDQFVKRVLRAKYYIRYVDDFVIAGETPEKLREYQRQIERFLKNKLELELHPDKTILRPIKNGIDFLGYIVRPEYKLIRRRTLGNWQRKLEIFADDPERGDIVNASYKGHVSQANAYHVIEKFIKQWQKLAPQYKRKSRKRLKKPLNPLKYRSPKPIKHTTTAQNGKSDKLSAKNSQATQRGSKHLTGGVKKG